MTKISQPGNKHFAVDGYKFEATGKLIDDFSAACKWLNVKKTDVMRTIMWEFVEEARMKREEGTGE